MPSYNSDEGPLLSGTVLVADDNPYYAQKICERLTDLGLETIAASDGEEAVRLYQASHLVAVLMDCAMPIMDGFTAAMRIRNYETNNGLRRVPILALTCEAHAGEQKRWIEAGMNDGLPKPVPTEVLRRELRRWLHDASHSELLLPKPRLRALG